MGRVGSPLTPTLREEKKIEQLYQENNNQQEGGDGECMQEQCAI